MKSIFGLLVCLSILVAGCDPLQYLIVENKHQNPENQIEILLKEFDSKNQNFINVFPLENDSLVVGKIYSQNRSWELITIRPNEENIIVLDFTSHLKSEELRLDFGIGKWSDTVLNSFANIIESFCITKQSNITCLKEQEEILKFLSENLDEGILIFEL